MTELRRPKFLRWDHKAESGRTNHRKPEGRIIQPSGFGLPYKIDQDLLIEKVTQVKDPKMSSMINSIIVIEIVYFLLSSYEINRHKSI